MYFFSPNIRANTSCINAVYSHINVDFTDTGIFFSMLFSVKKIAVSAYIAISHLTLSSWGLTTTTQQISLRQAIEQSLQYSPVYLQAKNQLKITQLQTKNTRSAFLPSLDLNATHGVQGANPDRTGEYQLTPWVSGTSLTLTETFYDNGNSYKQRQIAVLKEKLAHLQYEKSKAQVLRSVTTAYYRYAIAEQNLKFTKKNHAELNRLANLVSNQFKQGLKTRKDELSFRSREQRGQLNVINAEKNLVLAKSQLLESIGLAPGENIKFDTAIKPILPSKTLAIDITVDKLYEAEILSLQREIGDIEISLAQRKFWPELSLIGTASYGSSKYIDTRQSWDDNDGTQWSLLFNLKFNLIDWGVRSRNIQIAASTQSQTEQSARITQLQAENNLESFKIELQRATESYRISKELQKMEEDTFTLLERDYNAGRSNFLELTTGLANLLDAQSRGLEADLHMADLYLQWKYYTRTLNEETLFQ